MMLAGRDPSLLVAVLIVGALVAVGPAWSESPSLGDGTAEIEIVSPAWLDPGTGPTGRELATTPGRFGTAATYVRMPDLVVDVTNVTGTPELYYDVDVPAIEVDTAAVERRLTGPGRYRLHLADVALPPGDYQVHGVSPPEPGTYTGRVTVRVQSFSAQTVVVNRTVQVRVEG